MVDEKKLIAKLGDWAKESKEESGLKEPALLQKVMDEVKDMAVNEEIKARIEREDTERLTTDDPVEKMGMFQLAHNSCYIRDGKARYRDYELDEDARTLTRKLLKDYADGDDAFDSDEDFDNEMVECLQYGTDSIGGLIALFYRNLCAMADLRERLKVYEDKGIYTQKKEDASDSGWIPVSKYLPEHEDDVIVTVRGYGRRYTEIDRYDLDFKSWETFCDDGEVIAWMPLPEPYGKGE